MIGQVIGNYKIQAKLGEGGMGAVYKGVDTMLDREVAIKALRPELVSQTAVVERFRSEAVTLAKLHHPNIATLYSLFRQGDELYMVLEFVSGETLDAILARRGALSADEVIPVFCQILDGINHAHEYGIIHRDIKPANMMLTEKGTLKVLDFGIARLLGSNRMTRAGNIIGTLEYMSPEQVKGLETDARSDIYALGMMLFEVLTGRTPFDTENEFELMKLQIEALPLGPRSINPSIPIEVEEAIWRAIQKNPDDRFQTAAEFREVLLDAGYASQGAMYRTSGLYQKAATVGQRPTPPISKPGFIENAFVAKAENAPISKDIIKETRLGQPAFAPPTLLTNNIKGARLGESIFTNSDYDEASAESEKSFFSNLTWVHYTAGGVSAAFFLGLLILIPMFIFGGDDTPNKPQEVKSSVNASNANKPVEKAEQKSKPAPTSTLTPYISQPVVEAPTQPITYQTPIGVPLPMPKEPEKKTAPNTPVKQLPPRQAPKPAPPTRKKTGGGSIDDARCKLTGDC